MEQSFHPYAFQVHFFIQIAIIPIFNEILKLLSHCYGCYGLTVPIHSTVHATNIRFLYSTAGRAAIDGRTKALRLRIAVSHISKGVLRRVTRTRFLYAKTSERAEFSHLTSYSQMWKVVQLCPSTEYFRHLFFQIP